MADKSKKQNGITITRKDTTFTVKWSLGEKYNKQDLDYRTKSSSGTSSWHSLSIDKNDTHKKFEVVISGFGSKFPTLNAVEIRIRGLAPNKKKKKKTIKMDWSDYATKTMKLKTPPKPKITSSLVEENATKFVIESPGDAEKKPVSGIDYEYITVTGFNKKKINDKTFPAKGFKSDRFTTKSKSLLIKTEGSLQQSETTIVRARSYGISGNSGWTYASHTYASPYKPKNLKLVKYSTDPGSNTTKVNLSWTAGSDRAHPIDQTIIQYLIGTPVYDSEYVAQDLPGESSESAKSVRLNIYQNLVDKYGTAYYSVNGLYKVATYDTVLEAEYDEDDNFEEWKYDTLYYLETSIDLPDGASFTDGKTQKDTTNSDSATLILDTIIGVDQCLWARIAVKHDSDQNRVFSDYILVKKGMLAAPTITKIETVEDTYKASVTVQNNSQVVGSFVALVYQDHAASDDSGKVIGIVQNGTVQIQCFNWKETGPITIGAYAVVGCVDVKGTTETTYEDFPDPVKVYALKEEMISSVTYEGGEVPVSPTNVAAVKLPERDGTVQVTWDIPWLEATGAEISWADHDDAWYSTDGPTTYTVESIKKPLLNVTGLETGTIWYFCVRLYKQSESGEVIYGAPSTIIPCDLAEAPAIPILELSTSTTPVDKEVKGSWVYTSFDKTDQESAEIGEIMEEGSDPVVIDSLNPKTEQFVTFIPSELGWETGPTHQLAVRVHSQSGKVSGWSNPESLSIAEPPTCTITGTSLSKKPFNDNTELVLTTLPMRIEAVGSNESDEVSVFIRRYDDYAIERPDDSEYVGYAGDYIVSKNKGDGDYIEITADDLKQIGTQFDDGAKYQLIVRVMDQNGQVKFNTNDEEDEYIIPDPVATRGDAYYALTADINIEDPEKYYTITATEIANPVESGLASYYELNGDIYSHTKDVSVHSEKTYYNVQATPVDNPVQEEISTYYEMQYEPAPVYEYFVVSWDHQAIIPEASVEMIDNDVAKIHIGNPTAPEGTDWETEEGDHVDIYRLSAGKPQLIYHDAQFNTDYADPYPTIGKRGGYRIVFVTSNGDYIVEDEDGKQIDWLDIDENASVSTKFQYIDFDDKRLEFKFNVKFSNSWKKNFTLTHYLSGKVEGDWLAGTEHTNNISGVTIDDLVDDDIEEGTLDELYDLAEYSNSCHIRTIEGFNYCANIEVSDSSEYGHPEHPHDISLSITEVPNTEYDAVPWDEWELENEE